MYIIFPTRVKIERPSQPKSNDHNPLTNIIWVKIQNNILSNKAHHLPPFPFPSSTLKSPLFFFSASHFSTQILILSLLVALPLLLQISFVSHYEGKGSILNSRDHLPNIEPTTKHTQLPKAAMLTIRYTKAFTLPRASTLRY